MIGLTWDKLAYATGSVFMYQLKTEGRVLIYHQTKHETYLIG